MWQVTSLDVVWAQQEADNWMYSNKIDVPAGQYTKERQLIVEILLYSLEKLGVHVAEKPDRPNQAWMDLKLGDKSELPMPSTACRLGYEYALSHIPVEV